MKSLRANPQPPLPVLRRIVTTPVFTSEGHLHATPGYDSKSQAFYAADALSISVDRCVYVGDDLRDVQAGNAAGMPTIVAAYGYLGETGDCTGWPATGWIASPGELLAWLA